MLDLSKRDRCFIIAEAGTCHASGAEDHRVQRAMEYVYAALEAGANAIKFQMFDNPAPDSMFCWIDGDEERAPRWQQSEMGFGDWAQLKDECDARGIVFLASVFEHETVRWLTELDVAATKVASRAAGDLAVFADAPRPLIVSDGMYAIPEKEYIIQMQCEAHYPSARWWAESNQGFSDHSGTPWRALDAMARGCKILEVHFALEDWHAGPDLPASLDVDDLEMLCRARDAFAEKP